jgi:hypothetical protein
MKEYIQCKNNIILMVSIIYKELMTGVRIGNSFYVLKSQFAARLNNGRASFEGGWCRSEPTTPSDHVFG